jgi:xanthine dehydrogenase accessory factor
MSEWIAPLRAALAAEGRAVLVTLALTRGSTPRDAGAGMIVTPTRLHGTIGGGHLEFEAIAAARSALSAQRRGSWLLRFPLAARLGQCCGGVAVLLFRHIDRQDLPWLEEASRRIEAGEKLVLASRIDEDSVAPQILSRDSLGEDGLPPELRPAVESLLGDERRDPKLETNGWFLEPLARCEFRVVLFGNGHVGRALAQVLGTLPCAVTWVDEREEDFPANPPANVMVVATDAPEAEVRAAAPGSMFVVMTHSHPLDLELCAAILARSDFAYFGLIGSNSKRAQFERRLAARGVSPSALARMTCPIGLPSLRGKAPGVIAVSVAAELVAVSEWLAQAAPGATPRPAQLSEV